MDANGQRFWMLADDGDFRARSHVRYEAACRLLSLASERVLPEPNDPAADFAAANGALESPPCAADAEGTVAHFDAASLGLVSRSSLPGEAVLLTLPEACSDFAVGFDDVLYIALANRVLLHDLRGRWADVEVVAAGFAPWRLTAAADGGVWVLERSSGRLARLSGLPLPTRPFVDVAPGVFRPEPENCRPPQLRVLPDLPWPAGERPVALDCTADAGLALLSWMGDGFAGLRRYSESSGLGSRLALTGARYAYSLAWLDGGTIAVRMPGRRDAPAFALGAADASGSVLPSGEIFPLSAEALEAPFAHRLNGPPLYPVALAEGERGAEPLFRLSAAHLALRGSASNFDEQGARLLDSGAHNTVWHRLYAEASLPAQCGMVVWLAATASATPPPASEAASWCAHRFGEVPAEAIPLAFAPATATAAWLPAASELPHHPGLGPFTPQANRSGLFTVLVQNPASRVRRLCGRYLWMRIELFGDGRSSPALAALRCWGSRFSYRDHYLPRLYREQLFGAAAEAPGSLIGSLDASLVSTLDSGDLASLGLPLAALDLAPGDNARLLTESTGKAWLLQEAAHGWRLRLQTDAQGGEHIAVYAAQATPSDFLDRMLGNFEGLLTPLEDRIASAHLLTDPATVPQAHLDWLASWMALSFDAALPGERRRAWLKSAATLARWHGTRRGLALALDLASGGGVAAGRIVLVEDFRLRRILATLLGVDLADEADPLLPGLAQSGNSVVGETLFLGEAANAELLALFNADVATTAAENQAVTAFFERLAHRATVLVHQEVGAEDLGLLRRVVALESPAHVEVRVVTATWPFLVGVASLVGVDTFLGPPRPSKPATLDVSGLGNGDLVFGPATLDPRLGGKAAPSPPPTADAGDGQTVNFGESFELDGSRSSAAPGRVIDSYVWRRLPEPE